MARKNIDASDLGEVANDLRGLEVGLRQTYSDTLKVSASRLTDRVEDEAPVQGRPDGKESQVALSESFDWFSTGRYSAKIGSSAPHAIPVETGWDYGDWVIPKTPTGVGIPKERIDDSKFFLPNVGGVYDKETETVYYPQVNVGRYKGNNYNQRAARNYTRQMGENFNLKTKLEIIEAGFNEI